MYTKLLFLISIFQVLLIDKKCISIIISIKTYFPLFNSSNIVPYYTTRKLYSNIELGSPKQKAILLLSLKENSFYLDKNIITNLYSQYDYNKSSTSQLFSEFDQRYASFSRGAFISDDFYFLEKVNEPSKIFKNITFFLTQKDDVNICFTIGIGLQKNNRDKGFVNILKEANYINSYDWFLNYTNDNESTLIIGQNQHEYYPEYFSENQLLIMNSYCSASYLKWGIFFNKIYVNDHSFNDLLDSEININYGAIIIPYDYWDYITQVYFNQYINLNICSIVINSDKMRYFMCDKAKFDKTDINKAPIIHFFSVQFNYTFEIKGEDLFELINDKYYFLLFSETSTYSWILGMPFIKKYPFLFNIEARTISFYNPNIPYKDPIYKNENKSNQINIWIIIIILGAIFIIILIFTIFLIIKDVNKRKVRINELEDGFVYKATDTDNENKNQIINL